MTLDELLLEWSYRSERGYPSLDNPSDIFILENLLEKLKLPSNEVINKLGEATLSPAQLLKRNNIEVFLNKIKNNDEFTLKDGSTAVIDADASSNAINILKSRNVEGQRIRFTDTNGNILSLSLFEKTIEFGGAEKVSTIIESLKVRTDVKESLVILMCNIISNGDSLKPFNPDSFDSNMNIIKSSSNKFIDIEGDVQGYMEILFNIMETYKEFPTKSKRKSEAIFNNPYSIAEEILKSYSNPRFNRGDIFNKIRSVCSKIVILDKDKWNPGDIYLVNYEPTLPTETDSIVPWNDLFVNNWGDTDKPLVSISLKEEKYQPGRAKSYLTKFGSKVEYDLDKEELEWDKEKYKIEIYKLRESVSKLIENGGTGAPNEVIKQGDGWKGKYSEDRAKLQGTYGAYKLLEFILNHPDASIAGLFAYGQSISGIPSANPTFFKLVGGNKGALTKNEKYPGGSNTDLSIDEPITIIDTTTSANITVKGKLDIIKDGEIERTEDVSKTFRGDFGKSIGIV